MYNPDVHHRRSIRWPGFDYTQAGIYFVTLCVQDRLSLLGTMQDGHVDESPGGRMVRQAWEELPEHYPGVQIDKFIVMPDHLHGLLQLVPGEAETDPISLPQVVQRFKTWTTSLYSCGVRQENWLAYRGRLWQRNYYERVVHDHDEWRRLQRYIVENPTRSEDTPHLSP